MISSLNWMGQDSLDLQAKVNFFHSWKSRMTIAVVVSAYHGWYPTAILTGSTARQENEAAKTSHTTNAGKRNNGRMISSVLMVALAVLCPQQPWRIVLGITGAICIELYFFKLNRSWAKTAASEISARSVLSSNLQTRTHPPLNDDEREAAVDLSNVIGGCMATLIFDTWGTLVDNYSIADVLEQHVMEAHLAQDIAQDWRFQQKWAMFYTTLADNFVPHPGLTEACLRWALDKHHISLSESAIKDIVGQYHKLRAYPDVVNALKDLKSQGHVLKIVANPTKKMIEDHSKFAGTFPYLDEIISSGEEAQAFKPSPKVFQLGIARAGCSKEDILWVTGHFWEIVGAHRQGLKTAWTNRARWPILQIGVKPTYTTTTLQELADALRKQPLKGKQAVGAI